MGTGAAEIALHGRMWEKIVMGWKWISTSNVTTHHSQRDHGDSKDMPWSLTNVYFLKGCGLKMRFICVNHTFDRLDYQNSSVPHYCSRAFSEYVAIVYSQLPGPIWKATKN